MSTSHASLLSKLMGFFMFDKSVKNAENIAMTTFVNHSLNAYSLEKPQHNKQLIIYTAKK